MRRGKAGRRHREKTLSVEGPRGGPRRNPNNPTSDSQLQSREDAWKRPSMVLGGGSWRKVTPTNVLTSHGPSQ